VRQRPADVPVHVPQAIGAVRVVCEETAFVAVDCGHDDEERGRGRLEERERLGGFFQIALFADDGSDEGIVVFQ